MTRFYSKEQRVYLRRDTSQYGRIGASQDGSYYDCETKTQDVFWEHPGADIVSPVRVDDLMGEVELREYRRLFFAVMRQPEMRVLRLALFHLKWGKGIDWREIQEIEVSPPGDLDRCWMLTTEKYLVVCLDALNPHLTYEDFYFIWTHQETNPACPCEFCEVERQLGGAR